MFRGVTVVGSVLLIALATTARADQKGTPDEREACRRDVVKLCKGVPPEDFAMLDCLKAHRVRLSAACRVVLETHGQ
jgi:hypothetical protein